MVTNKSFYISMSTRCNAMQAAGIIGLPENAFPMSKAIISGNIFLSGPFEKEAALVNSINLVKGINTTTVRTAALAQGLYLISIANGDKPIMVKLVVD